MSNRLNDANARACANHIIELAQPGESGVMTGIVENIFGDDAGQHLLTPVQHGVPELQLLRLGESEAKGNLDSGEREILYVGGLPRGNGRVLHVIDIVPVQAAKNRELG